MNLLAQTEDSQLKERGNLKYLLIQVSYSLSNSRKKVIPYSKNTNIARNELLKCKHTVGASRPAQLETT
jgi:hypothetical protein